MSYAPVTSMLDARPPISRDQVEYLCWSRMQAEAGEGLEAIIGRKELERRVGQGLFLWGVGNAPSTSISALARIGTRVPVVFSVMKSRPKPVDSRPMRTVVWRRYFDADGVERELPPSAIVTSRGDSSQGAKRVHYALMCYSGQPLRLQRGRSFDPSAYRNASGTGAPIGASQVTALLRRVTEPANLTDYEANIEAALTESYWVRLSGPVEVPASLSERLSKSSGLDVAGWRSLAEEFRRLPSPVERQAQGLLI